MSVIKNNNKRTYANVVNGVTKKEKNNKLKALANKADKTHNKTKNTPKSKLNPNAKEFTPTKEIITLQKYLKLLKNKINDNTNYLKVYLLLDLTKQSSIDELSNLLHNKYVLKYLLLKFNRYMSLKKNISDKWGLCITGFLEQIPYRNEKKVIHKVGLVAYKIEKYEAFKKIFKSKRFYTSHKDSYKNKNFDTGKIDKRVDKIYDSMTKYLDSNKKNQYNYVLLRKINKSFSNGYTSGETSNKNLSNKVNNKSIKNKKI